MPRRTTPGYLAAMYTKVHIACLDSRRKGGRQRGASSPGGPSSRVARLTLLVTHSVRFYDTVDIANIPPNRFARCGGEQQTRLESVRRGADGRNRRCHGALLRRFASFCRFRALGCPPFDQPACITFCEHSRTHWTTQP